MCFSTVFLCPVYLCCFCIWQLTVVKLRVRQLSSLWILAGGTKTKPQQNNSTLCFYFELGSVYYWLNTSWHFPNINVLFLIYLKLQLWFYSNFQSHAATHTKPFNVEILKQKQNNIDGANSTDFFAPIWARYVILLLDDRQQAASFWQVAVIKLQQQCNIEAICTAFFQHVPRIRFLLMA